MKHNFFAIMLLCIAIAGIIIASCETKSVDPVIESQAVQNQESPDLNAYLDNGNLKSTIQKVIVGDFDNGLTISDSVCEEWLIYWGEHNNELFDDTNTYNELIYIDSYIRDPDPDDQTKTANWIIRGEKQDGNGYRVWVSLEKDFVNDQYVMVGGGPTLVGKCDGVNCEACEASFDEDGVIVACCCNLTPNVDPDKPSYCEHSYVQGTPTGNGKAWIGAAAALVVALIGLL